jgi:hypothetical protein
VQEKIAVALFIQDGCQYLSFILHPGRNGFINVLSNLTYIILFTTLISVVMLYAKFVLTQKFAD